MNRGLAALGLALCAGPAGAETDIHIYDPNPVLNLGEKQIGAGAVQLRGGASGAPSAIIPFVGAGTPQLHGGTVFPNGSINVRSGTKVYIEGKPAAEVSDLCFRPERPSCEAMLMRQIDAAKSQVRVSIYEWTLKSLGAALMRAKARGVDVAVVVDKASVRAPDAAAQAFEPHVNHAAGGLNHDKFVVIDREVLCTGSWNWTWSAEHKNSENAICLRSADVAARYLQHWEASAK